MTRPPPRPAPRPQPQPQPEHPTCARTGTVTTACVAGTTGTCACVGWTA